ncbi:MAG: hypothetical protein LW650_11435 [Planctomycetaceae bacterium]|nr:hypothetical protein [Phycisphaerales bacterium]MCE2654048.1 hypothetical protein [Planctomycetaceae bacterium]
MTSIRARRSAVVVSMGLVASATLFAGGCETSAQRAQLNEVRGNPTPELVTLHQRQDDVDNALTTTFDTNLRALPQDLGRMWLLDRPSRLTPDPIR